MKTKKPVKMTILSHLFNALLHLPNYINNMNTIFDQHDSLFRQSCFNTVWRVIFRIGLQMDGLCMPNNHHENLVTIPVPLRFLVCMTESLRGLPLRRLRR